MLRMRSPLNDLPCYQRLVRTVTASRAVRLRVYDDAGNVMETYKHAGEVKEWGRSHRRSAAESYHFCDYSAR
jgi:hypothetical protein